MEAETQKKESELRHRKLAEEFTQAEKKVYELGKQLHKDIVKSKPYFDMKDGLNTTLSEVKTQIIKLQAMIGNSKRAYSFALSNLESISEEIHKKRTPGVGAESTQDAISGDEAS